MPRSNRVVRIAVVARREFFGQHFWARWSWIH